MISITRPLQRLASHVYRISLVPVFALLLLVMWGAVIYQLGQEQVSAARDAVAGSQSLARTLADHTSYILRQTDHATQLFKLKYEESGGGLRLNEFTRRQGLLDSVLPSKLELPIALVDAHGNVVDSANAYFPENLAHQAFFRAWSRLWAQQVGGNVAAGRLAADIHAPGPLRSNVPLANLPAFATAWGCQPGQPMRMPEAGQVRVWR